MNIRLSTSAALAAAVLALAGCWEEESETAGADTGVITEEAGTEGLEQAETIREINAAEGEQAVEAMEEEAEIVSEDAAIRSAENDGVEITDQDRDAEVPINRLADQTVPPATSLNTDDAVAADLTDPAGGTTEPATGTSARTETVTSRTGAASQAATDAAVEAIDSGESPAEAAKDEARMASDVAGTVGAEAGLDTALTVGGFDMEVVEQAIEDSGLDEIEKSTLISGVRAASNNPEILDNMLLQVRAALDVD